MWDAHVQKFLSFVGWAPVRRSVSVSIVAVNNGGSPSPDISATNFFSKVGRPYKEIFYGTYIKTQTTSSWNKKYVYVIMCKTEEWCRWHRKVKLKAMSSKVHAVGTKSPCHHHAVFLKKKSVCVWHHFIRLSTNQKPLDLLEKGKEDKMR